jgi:hypothetical protein
LVNLDTKTWNSEDDTIFYLQYNFDNYTSVWSSVQYGDSERYPPTESTLTLPGEISNILKDEPCLPYDKSVCLHRAYNYSIGYVPSTVTLGLYHLTDITYKIHQSFFAASLNGTFKPDTKKLDFIKAVLEPDLMDGWYA